MDLHHPLVRSVLLPAVLALLLCGALRSLAGPRWAAAGAVVALLLSSTWVLGWPPRWDTLTGALPWVLMATGLLGAVMDAAHLRAQRQWLASALLWALALLLVGPLSWADALPAWLAGVVVLGVLAHARTDTADAPAMLAVGSLGLAAVAMGAASMLLFELSLGLALALAGSAVWLWPRPRIAFGPVGRVALGLAWLTLAYATLRLTHAPPLALSALVAGFALAGALSGWSRASAPLWARPLWRALPMALAAAAAVALTLGAAAPPDGSASPEGAIDDPYYTPRW